MGERREGEGLHAKSHTYNTNTKIAVLPSLFPGTHPFRSKICNFVKSLVTLPNILALGWRKRQTRRWRLAECPLSLAYKLIAGCDLCVCVCLLVF